MFRRANAPSGITLAAISLVLAVAAVFVWPPQPVPATGQVVAAYAFSEGTGTSTADFSSQGNGGTLTGGSAWSTAGRYGNALSFDGVDDAVVVADSSSLDLATTFTLGAWIHPTAAIPSGTVIRKAGTSGDPYALGLTAAGMPYVTVTTFAGTTTFVGDEPIFPNQWTHLAAAYTGGSLRLFVNGIKEWSWPLSGAVATSTGSLTIGGSATGGFLEGRIDEVRVDAFALDVGHVRDDMALPVDPATALTVGTHTPASGARGVLVTPISARFTRNLDPSTVTSATFQLRQGSTTVSANLAYDTLTRTVTLTPTNALFPLTDYSVTVLDGPGGVKDSGGAELAATEVWSFQTGSDANSVRLAYGFVEGAGATVDDASGNGNSGTLMNSPTWTTDGKYGRALVFDGVNDTIRVSDADTQDATIALTLEAWIYPTTSGASSRVLFKQNFAPEHSYWLGLSAGAPYARIRTSAGTYPLVGPAALPVNQWTHLAATYDGVTLRVFVNGLEVANAAAMGELYVSHKPLWVGSGFNADYFSGRIDDVRLYVRALTPAEIVDDMDTSVEDVTGPTVTVTSPIPDALDVPAGASVTAAFNEPLAAGSVSSSTFELRDALGVLIPASVSYDAPSRTATLDPGATLAAGSVYTATLKGGTTGPRITDVAGNPLATGYSWSFTTSTSPGAPTVVSVSLFPRSMSLSIGGSHQFTTTGHYSDGTSSSVTNTATWQASGSAVSVNTSGRATGQSAGDAVVSATFGGHSAEAPVTVYEGEAIPPDPADVAPPLNPTVATRTADATAFLYTGENPIQRGVAAGTIDVTRAAAVRGRLFTPNAQGALVPLDSARVTIVGRPEFGYTLTRLDGGYDLAVNGGGSLTVRFEKPNFLPAQRTLPVGWGDFVVVPDIALVGLDPQVTTIDLAAAAAIQVARGSIVSDADGQRRATVMFAQGTTASLQMPDGTTQPLSTLHARATEYTVGPNGEAAMPAPLPPGTAYTYAVELSADEALAAGATSVTFSAPVPLYVENFLGLPVGTLAPSGYYDRAARSWIPSANGVVLGIVSVDTTGRAEVDIDGDGFAEDATTMTTLGMSDDERRTLALTYATGQSLWRVPVAHFTPYDINWIGYRPDFDVSPQLDPPVEDSKSECTAVSNGSIIECQNQVLGERLAIAGTPFSLNYRSDRVPGRRVSRALQIPLTEAQLPSGVRGLEVEVTVAGQRSIQTFPATAGQTAPFQWDGRDAYGRTIEGRQKATITVRHRYEVEYAGPDFTFDPDPAFGRTSVQSRGVPGRADVIVAVTSAVSLGTPPRSPVGGWSLDVHHAYDPASRTVSFGDGGRRTDGAVGRLANRLMPVFGLSMTAGPDGALYFVEFAPPFSLHVRRRVATGEITTLATVTNDLIFALALGTDGAVYYAQRQSQVCGAPLAQFVNIRRIAEGTNQVVGAVSLPADFDCDGVFPQLVSDGADTFYLAAGRFLYRWQPGADAQFLTRHLNPILGIAAAVSGDVYLGFGGNGAYIDKRSPGGQTTRFAGTGVPTSSGDGGPALEAEFVSTERLALGPDGTLFVYDQTDVAPRVRQIATDGVVTTVAGGAPFQESGTVPDGSPATALFSLQPEMAVGPDGTIYVVGANLGVFAVRPPYGGTADGLVRVVADDGGQIFEFDRNGRHLRTRHALTGAVLYSFVYDAAGRLIEVRTGDGLVTQIERNAAGHPTAIVAPFGQRTSLSLDPHEWLSRVEAPGGRVTSLTSTLEGLLTDLVDPNGHPHAFTYNTEGRLLEDEDPAGGSQTLARTNIPGGWLATVTTAMGRVRSYRTDLLANGAQRLTLTASDGTQTVQTTHLDGNAETLAADGTRTLTVTSGDPRFGLQAPVPASVTVTTPAGLTLTSTSTRTATFASPADLTTLLTQTDTTVVNGRTYATVFDRPTRTFTTTTPAGRTSTSTVDAQGRMTRLHTGTLTPVDFTYDAQGRLTTITQGARQSTIAYDASGRPSTLTDALAHQMTFGYDAAGRVTTQTLPDLRTIQFGYDANSNVTALTPPGRPAHAFGYTPVDLTGSYTPPAVPGTGATTYGFNVDRQPTTIARPDGQTTSFVYGATNARLNTVTFSRGALQYGYDTAGRVSTLNDPGGVTLAFTYDGALPLSEAWSGGVTGSVSRTFTTNFEVATERVTNANEVSFGYDADRLLTQAGALTIARHAANGLVTGTTLGSTTEAFEYNGFGELSRQTASVSGAAFFDVLYTRDGVGRITQRTEVIDGITRVWEYGYDLVGRLESVRRNSTLIAFYIYDANGNRTQANSETGTFVATYDNQDRLLTYGGATYTYTANGELATKTVGTQVTTYEYDTLGTLMRVVLPNADVITYTVDGHGRRVAKAVNGTRVKGWLYADQLRPIAELDGSGTVVSRFVYGTRMNAPEYVIKSGVTYRIFSDHLGSPRIVLNASTGEVVQRLDFTAFGEIVQDSNPDWQPFGFAGGLHDVETGLVRFGARDYDPTSGRFISKDPLDFDGGETNLYLYASGNPVNRIDPDGLQADDSIRAAIRQGRVDDLRAVVDQIRDPKVQQVVKDAIKRLDTPVRDLIRASLKRSESYRTELEGKTLAQLMRDRSKEAQKMVKLAQQGERIFDKIKNFCFF